MADSSPACASCQTPLPADAVFCHRCGARTPQEINKATGEVMAPPVARDRDQVARLQAALGEAYEVRRLLGRGGFAEVYVAWDKRLKREVAVKTLRADLVGSENLLERFQAEAEAVAKLRHPNVIPIFTVGEGEGLAFYTMPLIEGESLAAMQEREGRLAIPEASRILRDAAHALHAAHRAGIVHRDVKPENIMLEGPERSVVVMDFGIAKSMSGGAEHGLTSTGMLIGTPQYMSPEQATGEGVDQRSDQYSLGMVGYRMVTGQLPFENDSVQTMLYKTVTELPPAPAVVATDVPVELSDALMRALAKRADARFPSMADFASTVGSLAGDRHAGPARTQRRVRDMAARIRDARQWIGRDRLFWAAAAIVMAAALFATLYPLPRALRMLARDREQAILTATTFVNSAGTVRLRSAYAEITVNDSALTHLRRATSFAATDARAASDIPIWEWSIALPARDKSENWQIWVAPGPRITGYRRRLADTATGARLTYERARDMAEVAVGQARLRGFTRLADSTIARKQRTDHLVRWVSNEVSVTPRGDTGRMTLRVTVAGNRVVAFRERYDVVAPAGRTGVAFVASFSLIVFVSIAGLFITAIRWSRDGEMQWLSVTRLIVIGGVLITASTAAEFVRNTASGSDSPGFGGPLQTLLTALVVSLIIGIPLLCAGVIGENLAHRRRPDSVVGFDDLSCGRAIIPEMVRAAPLGYLAGAGASLAQAIMTWVALRAGWRNDYQPHDAFSFAPIPDLLAMIGGSIAVALAVLAGVMIIATWRWTSRFVLILPALLVAGAAFGGNTDASTAFSYLISFGLLTAALWYGGLPALIIGLIVWELLGEAGTSLWAGGEFLVPGLVGIVLLFLPAATALIARKRVLRAPG